MQWMKIVRSVTQVVNIQSNHTCQIIHCSYDNSVIDQIFDDVNF